MASGKTRWIVAGMIVLVVVIGGAIVGGRLVAKRRATQWRTDGLAAARAGDYARANDLLERYLDRYPLDVDALAAYADSGEKLPAPTARQLSGMMSAYSQLVLQRPTNVSYRQHLLEMQVRFQRRPEALDTAKKLLAVNPHDLRALELKTRLLTELARYDEAMNVAQNEWEPAAVDDYRPYLAATELSTRLGRPADETVAAADRLRQAHPGDAGFDVVSAYADRIAATKAAGTAASNYQDQAVARLREAAGRPGSSDELVQRMAAEFDAVGLPQEAVDLLAKLAKTSTDPNARAEYARRSWELGRWTPVADELSTLDDRQAAADPTLLAMKAIALARLNSAPEAAACRQLLAKQNTAESRAWVIYLDSVLRNAPVDDGKFVPECRAALLTDPRNPYLRFYLGEAESRQGDPESAVESWNLARACTTTWSVPAARLVDSLLEQRQIDRALRVATEANTQTPGNLITAVAFARAWAAAIDAGLVPPSDQLWLQVEKIQAQAPGEAQTLLLLFNHLGRTGRAEDKDRAVKLAATAIDADPAPAEQTLLAIARTAYQFGLTDVAEKALARSQKQYGITADFATVKAAVSGSGVVSFDAAAKTANGTNRPDWMLARARLLESANDPGSAAAWRDLVGRFPNHAAILQAAAEAGSVAKAWTLMSTVIDRLHALSGDKGIAWRLLKARLMVEAARTPSDYEQGSVLLNAILKDQPDLADAHVLLAHALSLMNRPDGAIDQLRAAERIDPGSVDIGLQLAELLQQRGDRTAAGDQLNRVVPRIRTTAQRRTAADLLAEQGETAKAIELLQLPGGTNGLLLARLYRRLHQSDRCEAVVTELLKSPNPEIVTFAAALYASEGKPDRAAATLSVLDSIPLPPGVKELTLADYFNGTGDIADAVPHYDAATKQAPADASAWRGLASCLVRLNQSAGAVDALTRAAQAIPADPQFADLSKHADLLRSATASADLRPVLLDLLTEPARTAADLDVIQAVIGAGTADGPDAYAARLRLFVDRNPNNYQGQLQLVIADQHAGRLGDALSRAQTLTTAFPASADPAALAFELAAAAGKPDQMMSAARLWKQRAPDDFAADLAVAKAQIAARQFDAAMATLDPYMPAAKLNPDGNAELILGYAIGLINTGRQAEGEALVWPLAQTKSAWRATWIHLALECGDTPAASAMLDRMRPLLPPDATADRVTLALAYDQLARRASDAGLSAKATAEFELVAADPKVTGAQLAAAGSHFKHLPDLVRAEALFRRAIAADPKLASTANNLADLIADRNGDLKEAEQFARASVGRLPRSPEAVDTLARILWLQRRFPEAAEDEGASVKLAPDDRVRRVRYALYLLDAGNLVEALAQARSIKEAGTTGLTADDETQWKSVQKRISELKQH